jgi:uncharacterized iron-regulated membrane protein
VAKLDNYDGAAVADKALEAGLADEAFDIYKKIGKWVAARVAARMGSWGGAPLPLLLCAAAAAAAAALFTHPLRWPAQRWWC